MENEFIFIFVILFRMFCIIFFIILEFEKFFVELVLFDFIFGVKRFFDFIFCKLLRILVFIDCKCVE